MSILAEMVTIDTNVVMTDSMIVVVMAIVTVIVTIARGIMIVIEAITKTAIMIDTVVMHHLTHRDEIDHQYMHHVTTIETGNFNTVLDIPSL